MASAGHDRKILIWSLFSDMAAGTAAGGGGGAPASGKSAHVQNIGFCKGHKNAILDLKWDRGVPDEAGSVPRLHTCGADKLIMSWDMYDFSKIRSFKGHEDVVNAIDVSYFQRETSQESFMSYDMLVSGSND